jgi:two-component system, response regulator YesN
MRGISDFMNILIVDDDLLIRNWLKMLLHQIKNTEIKIYEASDGLDALQRCSENHIQLIITDIKMPTLNGIDLITRLKNEFPQIRFCVLSSYDDFRYVKDALKAGALDYILKAEMKFEDLSQILLKVQNSINMEEKYKFNYLKENENISNLVNIYKKYMYSDEDIGAEEFLKTISSSLIPENLKLVIFTVNIEGKNKQEFIASICMDTIQANCIKGISFPHNNEFYIMLYNSSESMLENQQEEYVKITSLLNNNLIKYENISLTDSLLLSYKSNKSIKNTIKDGIETIHFCNFHGLDTKKVEIDRSQNNNKAEFYKLIQKYIDLRDYDKVTSEIINYIDNVCSKKLTPSYIKSTIRGAIDILLTSEIIVKSSNDKLSEKLDQLFENIINSKNPIELKMNTINFLSKYTNYIKSEPSIKSLDIKAVVKFIDDNYMNKITLDDVSNHVFLNSSYLSQLFKKEMSITFSDYLEDVRIKNAKFLLKEPNKAIIEIAEEVGFSSQNYFTKIFKKITGLTPAKYKNIHK